jgi:hypothetical protein
MKKNGGLALNLTAASLILFGGSGCKSKPTVSLIDDGGGRTTNDFPELAAQAGYTASAAQLCP